MARPSEEFILAWSSLSGHDLASGWQVISLTSAGPIEVQAGRRSPDNVEAILLYFPSSKLGRAEKLPEGKGFLVERAGLRNDLGLRLSLTRKADGSNELFVAMACDVVGAMDDAASSDVADDKLLKVFIRRVVAWQQFMSRGVSPLSPEAELGLVGELVFMSSLLQAGVSTETALEGWVGPDDAPQDFVLGDGAIEVKATLSTAGFPVKIGSLEQLNDALVSPLYLAAVRFSRGAEGLTLPEIVSDLESQLAGVPGALTLIRGRLLSAGFIASHSHAYTRAFEPKEVFIFAIKGEFPRLTTGAVPDGVFRAMYEIDLDHARAYLSNLPAALRTLGVLL